MKLFFWIDLEMTGLDETMDHILEVAVIITDVNLNPVDQYHRVVFQPKEILDHMNDWCKKTHGDSGLTAEVSSGLPLPAVEKELLALVEKHYGAKERVILAGNSVWNDRKFIDRHLPELAKRLHYRLVDVSSFKEIYRSRYGVQFAKGNAHRAVGDIVESINELKHYLSFIQIPKPTIPGTHGTQTS